jgi:type I restriction enzyme M protein
MDQIFRSGDWKLDLILTNPPFGPGHPLPPTARSSIGALAFLESSMATLESGGRCGIVVPDGILFRDESLFRKARERLLTEFAVIAVVRLPAGTFAPAPSVRTNLLVFENRTPQPDLIRYYQVRSRHDPRSRSAVELDGLEGALAWVRDGKPDRYSWEVRAEDVMCGDWSLDVPWPGEDVGHTADTGGQLALLPDLERAADAQATVKLGAWIERRGAKAGGQAVDHLLGVSKDGFAPFKGRRSSDTRDYRRVQAGEFAYNPMRAALGAIALCREAGEEGWVSPAYVVFRLKRDASIGDGALLEFLKSPAGMAEVDRHSHGSVRRRLRFKDLAQLHIPASLRFEIRRSD